MFDVSHKDAVKDFLKLSGVNPDRPNVNLLGKLTDAFLRFPYENLTKIIRVQEESDPMKRLRMPGVVLGDHVDIGAGGTCFSLTYFFRQVLERCGFNCETVLCDRSYGPDTHCALVTSAEDGRYLVDPGYLLQYPLAMPEAGESKLNTSTGGVSLKRLGQTSQYLLITHQGGKSSIRYRLKGNPASEDVFRNRWIDSFSWAQMRHLCVTQLRKEGRVYMRDRHLRFMTSEKKSQTKLAKDYERVVSDTFGLDETLIDKARSIIHESDRTSKRLG
jgi:arylamine N-acetyltransferase